MLKKITKILMPLLMALPFIFFDVFLRFFVGKTVLDGHLGDIMAPVFNVLWIVFICTLCLLFPKKTGRILYGVFLVFNAVWCFANYIYHCVFKQFLWVGDIKMAGEGSDYLGVVFDYAPPVLILLSVVFIAFYIFFVGKFSSFGFMKSKIIILLICAVGVVVADWAYINVAKKQIKAGAWEVWQKPALIYNEFRDSKKSLYTSGFYQYTFKSVQKLFEPDETDIKKETEFAKSYFKQGKDNEMTGILKGKNIIFVLMESIDDFLITDEYTPEIKRMMSEGISFENHYSPNMGTGYTFNSEFAANTGFYCPTNESSASVFTKNIYPQTLANRLKNEGYTTSAVHFNSRQFYNREAMYKKWGYDNYYCLMEYMSIEKCVIDSDAIKNDKVYSLMTQNKPFMTYFITYSAHLPYNTVDNKLKGIREYYPDKYKGDSEIETLRLLAHDTDEFFKILNLRLEEEGIAEDTVIVAYADHYAYGITDGELLKNESKKAGSEILEKTPFFIYCKGMESKKVNKVTSSADILPTLENLFGMEKMNTYIGADAFGEKDGLVYFSDGRWFDGKYLFKPEDNTQKNGLISEIEKYINDSQRVNDFVVEYDYFRIND